MERKQVHENQSAAIKRIKNNIVGEAQRFVKYGVPMSTRDERWSEFEELALGTAYATVKPAGNIATLSTEASKLCLLNRKIASLAARQALDLGITKDEWLEQAYSYYTISADDKGTWSVVSCAASPTKTKEWIFRTESAAKNQFLKLVQYKIYDHFQRVNPAQNFRWS